ncbi:MAG: hypothetical protein JWP01_3771 [Myxococcales bacterium]|nr:hypothetical protein [Myxococcales bacterium]
MGDEQALGGIVEIESRTFAVPFECPCCGAAADAEVVVPLKRAPGRTPASDSARRLEFPYCARCVAHVASWEGAGVTSAGIMLVGILASVAVAIVSSVLAGLVLLVGAVAISAGVVTHRRARAAAACGPACASPDAAVSYLGWSGNTSSFSFRSPTYTARFAEHNSTKLVSVSPELRRLLEGHRVARLAVPTPAAAAMTVPPPRSTREWIAKIESTPGRVARRHHLQVALDLAATEEDKAELIRAAMRSDLAPLRARLDKLSGSAKHRALSEAIAEIRAGNLPVELQQAELAELERMRAS